MKKTFYQTWPKGSCEVLLPLGLRCLNFFRVGSSPLKLLEINVTNFVQMICSWYIVCEILHRNSSFRMNPAKNIAALENYFFLIICQEIAVKVGVKHQVSTIDIPVFEILYKDSLFWLVLLKYMAAVGNSCIRNYKPIWTQTGHEGPGERFRLRSTSSLHVIL